MNIKIGYDARITEAFESRNLDALLESFDASVQDPNPALISHHDALLAHLCLCKDTLNKGRIMKSVLPKFLSLPDKHRTALLLDTNTLYENTLLMLSSPELPPFMKNEEPISSNPEAQVHQISEILDYVVTASNSDLGTINSGELNLDELAAKYVGSLSKIKMPQILSEALLMFDLSKYHPELATLKFPEGTAYPGTVAQFLSNFNHTLVPNGRSVVDESLRARIGQFVNYDLLLKTATNLLPSLHEDTLKLVNADPSLENINTDLNYVKGLLRLKTNFNKEVEIAKVAEHTVEACFGMLDVLSNDVTNFNDIFNLVMYVDFLADRNLFPNLKERKESVVQKFYDSFNGEIENVLDFLEFKAVNPHFANASIQGKFTYEADKVTGIDAPDSLQRIKDLGINLRCLFNGGSLNDEKLNSVYLLDPSIKESGWHSDQVFVTLQYLLGLQRMAHNRFEHFLHSSEYGNANERIANLDLQLQESWSGLFVPSAERIYAGSVLDHEESIATYARIASLACGFGALDDDRYVTPPILCGEGDSACYLVSDKYSEIMERLVEDTDEYIRSINEVHLEGYELAQHRIAYAFLDVDDFSEIVDNIISQYSINLPMKVDGIGDKDE